MSNERITDEAIADVCIGMAEHNRVMTHIFHRITDPSLANYVIRCFTPYISNPETAKDWFKRVRPGPGYSETMETLKHRVAILYAKMGDIKGCKPWVDLKNVSKIAEIVWWLPWVDKGKSVFGLKNAWIINWCRHNPGYSSQISKFSINIPIYIRDQIYKTDTFRIREYLSKNKISWAITLLNNRKFDPEILLELIKYGWYDEFKDYYQTIAVPHTSNVFERCYALLALKKPELLRWWEKEIPNLKKAKRLAAITLAMNDRIDESKIYDPEVIKILNYN